MMKSKSRLTLLAAAALMSVSLSAVAAAPASTTTAVVQVEVCANPGTVTEKPSTALCDIYVVPVPADIKEASFDVGFAKPLEEDMKPRGRMFGLSAYLGLTDKKPGIVVVRYNGHYGEESKKFSDGTTTDFRMQSASQLELVKGGSKTIDFNKVKVTLTRID